MSKGKLSRRRLGVAGSSAGETASRRRREKTASRRRRGRDRVAAPTASRWCRGRDRVTVTPRGRPRRGGAAERPLHREPRRLETAPRRFSGDHKNRCLDAALRSAKPFALLLPAYVVERRYFRDACASKGAAPCFLKSATDYAYAHPHGTGKAAPPFQSVWVIDSGKGAAATARVAAALAPRYATGTCSLHRSPATLRQGGAAASERKRPNPKARKKRRRLAEAAGGGS